MRARGKYAAVAAALVICGAFPARAQWQPDPRPIQYQYCKLGGTGTNQSQIAVGGTAVTVPAGGQPGGAQLRGFILENPSSATESLFFDPTGNAASTTPGISIELQAGISVSFGPGTIPNKAISINAATAGHKFNCMYGQ